MKSRPILFSAPMIRAILSGAKTQTRRVVNPQPAALCRYEMNGSGNAALHLGPPAGAMPYTLVPPTPTSRDHRLPCPYGAPDDRLWVRETWGLHAYGDETDWFHGSVRGVPEASLREQFHLALRADWGPLQEGCFWRPGIFMPRWASRITLEVTEVRVQRLQEITAADACDEGAAEILEPGHPLRSECYEKHGIWTGDERLDVDGPFAGAVAAFAALWDSINGKPRPMLDDDGEPVLDDDGRPRMVASRSWSSNPWVWAVTFRMVHP